MTMAESSTLAVLARKANRSAFEHERTKSQLFGQGPVDTTSAFEIFGLGFDLPLNFGVEVESPSDKWSKA